MRRDETIAALSGLLNAGQAAQALALVKSLPQRHADDLEVQFMAGRCMMALEDFSGGQVAFLRLLAQNPKDVRSILHLGHCFVQSQQYGAAIACVSNAIRLRPDDTALLKLKSALYELQVQKNNQDLVLGASAQPQTPAQAGKPKVLVLCAGQATRWNSHLGIKHKHLIPVEGEFLLDRTLRQVQKYTPRETVVLVPRGESHCFAEVCQGRAALEEIGVPVGIETPAWKYLSSQNHWNEHGTTLSLLGDVWFSDAAMDCIFGPHDSDWLAFGRLSASAFTACPYGEIFAHRFHNRHKHLAALQLLNALYLADLCSAQGSGWALSQMISNEDPNIRSAGRHFVQIDDFTEDFDFPQDLERWLLNHSRAGSPA